MKAKIDKNGHLYLERAGKMKKQFCKYTFKPDGKKVACGDWCPQFGIWENMRGSKAIGVCENHQIPVDEIIDERYDEDNTEVLCSQ